MKIYDYATKYGLNILRDRADGKTLHQLAAEHGVTHEWIRRMEIMQLSEIPDICFDEFQYEGIANNINLNSSFVSKEILINQEFRHARYFLLKMKGKNKKSLHETIDLNLPADFLERFVNAHHLIIWSDGKITRNSGIECSEQIGRLLKEFDAETVKSEAHKFVIYGSLGSYSGSPDTMLKSPHIIRTGPHGKMRYYRRDLNTISEILSNLNYPENGNYTAKRVYYMNRSTLRPLEIRNGYELHSIMKFLSIENIIFGKCPALKKIDAE